MRHTIIHLLLLMIVVKANGFELKSGHTIHIACDTTEMEPVVKSALKMLVNDFQAVLSSDVCIGKEGNIIINKDTTLLDKRKEAFQLKVSNDQLYVTGSDAHGVAYGILEISRLIGVSPWEWWADVMPLKRSSFSLANGYVNLQAPSVEFRGIFINDEDWGLMPWSSLHYEPWHKPGRIGPKTNARIFELMLRLRANTYWPAMHECTQPFFLTQGNREVAEQYGIYIGGSHCEPMASSTAGEWRKRGKGEYDYVNNSKNVYEFWEQRVKEVANQPILYTIGMRGVHDGAMNGAKTIKEQKAVLQHVFADQRHLLQQYVNQDVTKVPQVFIPYKEVMDIYDAGLEVPEDVCLMWCDDNYGYIHHFPTDEERQRKGGNGVYYHISYWGRPHDYLWLGTFSPALLYQQMTTAYDSGIQKLWVLNVGDIKPAEYQIELFMDMAWDIHSVKKQGITKHLSHFLQREFGNQLGKRLLPLMKEHYRLAYIRKPEFMGNTREEEYHTNDYRIIKDMPWSEKYIDTRLAAYQKLEDEVETCFNKVIPERQDAYFQLVKYPLQASAEMNKKILYAQKARHGLESWSKSDAAFDSIASLTRIYNIGFHNNSKWHRMMDFQPRRLPVFEPVDHKAATSPIIKERKYIAKWNGADCTNGDHSPCEGLGYEEKAITIPKNKSVNYTFDAMNTDSVEIEVHLLPCHPIEGKSIRIALSLDGHQTPASNYETYGRSEIWKENVLRNKAILRFTLPLSQNEKHCLQVKAIDKGVILDQLFVFPQKQ